MKNVNDYLVIMINHLIWIFMNNTLLIFNVYGYIHLIYFLILFNVHAVSLICVCLPVWSVNLSKLTLKNKH